MFEPEFFDNDRLFGFYHPANNADSDRLLVVCPPLFDEYRRCYKAISELAKGCAAEGTHVFRFDYFGTGESWGTLEEASVQTWIGDVQAAIEEGLALSGANRVYLCGVRFGATLAAQIQHPRIVEYLFWDLIPSGRDALAQLTSVDDELNRLHVHLTRYNNVAQNSGKQELFHINATLRSGIASLQVDLRNLSQRARVHQVVCQASRATEGAEFSGFDYDWPPFPGGLLLPKPVLEVLARRLV
jgi:hypothetical protein